jgi:hypothetical protein
MRRDSYTQCLLRRTGKGSHISHRPAHTKVGLGIYLRELAGQGTSLSLHDGG